MNETMGVVFEARETDTEIVTTAYNLRVLPVQAVLGSAEQLFAHPKRLNALKQTSFVAVEPPVLGMRRIDWAYIQSLEADREYVTVFEKHGLDGLNKLLATRLNMLGWARKKQEQQDIITNISGLIHAAIYIIPHVARTVQITLNKDWQYLLHSQDLRFSRVAENLAWIQQIGSEGDNLKFRFLLPYDKTKLFNRTNNIRSEISFAVYNINESTPHQTKTRFLPVIGLYVIKGKGHMTIPYYNIESIRFCRDEPPTRLYPQKGQAEKILEPNDPVAHYLKFRLFRSYEAKRIKLSEKVGIHPNLLEPEPFDPLLWDELYDAKGTRTLRRGFLALTDPDPEHTRLFEFENMLLPYSTTAHTAQAYLAGLVVSNIVKVKSYKGNEIIRRLASIPVVAHEYRFPVYKKLQ